MSLAVANTSADNDRHNVIFDGMATRSVVVMVDVPPERHIRVQSDSKHLGHPYVMFGRLLGKVDGRDIFFNTHIHAINGGMERLRTFFGKKAVGHPVIVEKTLPDGRTFCHLDVYLAEREVPVNYRVLTRIDEPTEKWWHGKCNRQPDARDFVHTLPGTHGGIIALMRLGR